MNASYASVIAPATLRLERTLPGPIERVWAYLTESEKRGQWFASGEMELRAGGKVALRFNNSSLTGHDGMPPAKYAAHAGESTLNGTITECQPQHLLAYTFGDTADASPGRFELSEVGDRVLLTIVHSRLRNRDEMLSVAGGWHTHVDILADRLDGRTPAGFWPTHTRLEAEYDQRIARG